MAARARVGVVFVFAILASACALSHEPRRISIPQPGTRPATRMDQIDDYRTATATIAWIAERDLGFSQFPVTFHFYPNRDSFERALIGVGYDPSLARSTARTMMAVGGHRGVLLNNGKVEGLSWPERVALLAHELGHTLQYELGGGQRGTSDQWLREGFAEWLSLRVLERLNAFTTEAVRRARRSELHAAGRSKIPPLGDLVTFPQWVRAGEQLRGSVYSLAFLAVDFLLERHGVAAVITYFQRFAFSQDRVGNFRAAFGEDVQTFEAAMNRTIWGR